MKINTKNKNIIKKLHDHFNDMEFCVFTDDEFEILYIHHGLSLVFIDKNYFNLSFEVNCEPTVSAIITQEIIEFATKHKMKINIFEPYADVVDEDDVIQEVLFGEDAEHYHETGEVPSKEEKIGEKFPEIKTEKDAEKEVDTILDQISTNGMKSLNKKQKEFLLNYSKGNKQHKH